MKVRNKSSSFRLTIGIQFLLYSRVGSRVGYHSSKEGWPLACRRANAGFRLILLRAGRPLSLLKVRKRGPIQSGLEHGARIGEVHFHRSSEIH